MIIGSLEEYVNFISSKDTGETRTYYIPSDNSIMQGEDTNDILTDIFNSFLYNYEKVLKILKEASLYLKVLVY